MPFFNKITQLANRLGLGLRAKLLVIFLVVKVIPLILLAWIAWQQFLNLGEILEKIAVEDSKEALNAGAVDNIERMSTTAAERVAAFLYQRDKDLLYLAALTPDGDDAAAYGKLEAAYATFAKHATGRLIKKGEWTLAPDGKSWIPTGENHAPADSGKRAPDSKIFSTNSENDDYVNGATFSHRLPDDFIHEDVPLYDEITFIGLDGQEKAKVVTAALPEFSAAPRKSRFPMSTGKKAVSDPLNTYVKAETYWSEVSRMKAGEIYVSDVTGAYVGSNFIGMYTPEALAKAAEARGYPIDYEPEAQAYAGEENPNGRRFEGIVRWATPVAGQDGKIVGYVTFALNHDHLMEFVDHLTPMAERYTELPSADVGNYAFIWDYMSRSICHPRHHSIVGFDPETGKRAVPWLESGLYDGMLQAGFAEADWEDYIKTLDYTPFDSGNPLSRQSRSKRPAPELTRRGLIGLDGRYLNNAPQCTGWLDLTRDGGSGSLYILWSGIYKLNTAAAIPYYTGQYAPSEANGWSRRGFGFVAIGSGLEDFTRPATETEQKLEEAIQGHLTDTFFQLAGTTAVLIVLVVLIAVWMASFLTNQIKNLIEGISRFRTGERQFRFNTSAKDEFGTLADSFDDMADSIVNSVRNPLCITDLNRKIIYMNEPGLAGYGRTLDEMLGATYGGASFMYVYGSEYCPITALEEGREATVYHRAEDNRYLKARAVYLLDNNGDKIGYIIESTDVTDIETARKKAEEGSRAKSAFLSTMSHEIRTPLNAIIGMTALGMSAPGTGRKDYCFGKIEDASVHLLGVINDILDISKIEANKFEIAPQLFNFEKLLQKVVNVINFRVGEKQHNLIVSLDKHIPRMLIADDQRLAQVMTNLLSNAVKFTPEGGTIRLNTRLLSEEDGLCSIQVEVTDTGIGISEEHQARLFSSFTQADSGITRKFGGTGLGLAISKHIIEIMGGRIWVVSELHRGSTFAFIMPARRGNGEKERRLLNPNVRRDNMRVLAVDDMPEILEYFRDIAQRFGINCDSATSGQEALELIRKNGPYDIYFVDWKMPGMDGIELSRRIRGNTSTKSVVIMISAAEWSSVEGVAKAAGVDKFLPKPLFPSAILDCINECLGENTLPEEPAARADDPDDFTGYCALLAEDVEINREIVLALLEPTGITIDCAENGNRAVEMFAAAPARYDLIFMDMQMPEQDGLQATRLIRALDAPQARTIPIVAMTANVFREDIEKCFAAGMNDHLGKPLDFDEVLKILRRYCPARASR
ncbi:MAG: response regulator [Deltaproteobacteria bacterium]|jgi:signal transduction histidine kinase/DNA-binding response OmpR family regulator/HAMP domain-containing protein|nr:response regulator [Deltaproteobacteria bacterium]